MLMRRTSRKKRVAKMKLLRAQMRKRRHEPLMEQHQWLCSVVRGHDNYYGVPTNHRALVTFHRTVQQCWYRQLQRRNQRSHWPVSKYKYLDSRYPLPPPRIVHPWPDQRFVCP
jgi:hypothetical protein